MYLNFLIVLGSVLDIVMVVNDGELKSKIIGVCFEFGEVMLMS